MKKIEIIMIPVADQQKAKDFYIKFGLQVLVEAEAAHGQTWIQLGFPGEATSISLSNFQGIIFETEDMDKDIEDLKTQGINAGQIDNTPWGKFAWLKDHDGNSLCLHQK